MDDVKFAYSSGRAQIMAMHASSLSSCLRSKFVGHKFCIFDIVSSILTIRVCSDLDSFFLIEKKLS